MLKLCTSANSDAFSFMLKVLMLSAMMFVNYPYCRRECWCWCWQYEGASNLTPLSVKVRGGGGRPVQQVNNESQILKKIQPTWEQIANLETNFQFLRSKALGTWLKEAQSTSTPQLTQSPKCFWTNISLKLPWRSHIWRSGSVRSFNTGYGGDSRPITPATSGDEDEEHRQQVS